MSKAASSPPPLMSLTVTLLPLLVFLLLAHSSVSVNPFYEDCAPRICGDLNISYPFYIQGQQDPYCGYPGFQILCENNTPLLNLSNDSYTLLNVSYLSQSVCVINSAFLGRTEFKCSHVASLHNLTLDPDDKFQLPSSYGLLYLLPNCSKPAPKGLTGFQSLPCVGGKGDGAIFAGYEKNEDLGGKCGTVISVAYDQQEGSSGKDVRSLLGRGISLNWMADNCSLCYSSGGRCGYNQSLSQFQCFCVDKTHFLVCHYHYPEKSRKPLILAIAILAGVVTATVLIAILWRCDKFKPLSSACSSGRANLDPEELSVYFGVSVFPYHELEEATGKFDPTKELGDGGFGTVYHGKLKDGREVAVKRLYEKNYKRIEQFMNEVQILTRLRHKNLVTLYGCTSRHSRELLLVYEYIPNGTVADHLHGDKAKPGSLPWTIRLNIAIESASALSYLHASDIIHRDVKTNNILLDDNFGVKVADFGLSRLFPSDVTHVSTAPQGTPGYVDPEYHQCYQLTDKSDVFSFGVVLVELISSLPAIDFGRRREEINLSDYAMVRIQRAAFKELVDPDLGFGWDYKVRGMTTSVAELAFQCLQHEKELRPSMDEVLESLKRIEAADYEAWRGGEIDKKGSEASQSSRTALSPPESDDVVLLKNVQHPPSPNTVMVDWASSMSTTPNTSS